MTDTTRQLSQPDDVGSAISRQLVERIREEISSCGGLISFRRYMEMALYEPGHGYYSAGARKIGADGDFITAPEISPLFSACLASQCEQIIQDMPGCSILELGAGSGVMAGDILRELDKRGSLPGQYLIMEPSADLWDRQRNYLQRELPALSERIVWLDRLPASPFTGIILANEVLDAMPVRRIKLVGNEFQEMCVSCKDGGFTWLTRPLAAEVRAMTESLLASCEEQLPDGYITEINPALTGLIGSLAEFMLRGVMLLIDYGYPRREYLHPQRTDGTLLCHYRHQLNDNPFINIGLQDITASVDFTAVAQSAVSYNLDVSGYSTQSGFLLACGMDEIMTAMAASNTQDWFRLAQQARQLLLPGEMGEVCKVMALTRDYDAPLMGFRISDQRHRL